MTENYKIEVLGARKSRVLWGQFSLSMIPESIVGKTLLQTFPYMGSPTYAVLTAVDPTTTILGLWMCKWGIFALVGDLLQSH